MNNKYFKSILHALLATIIVFIAIPVQNGVYAKGVDPLQIEKKNQAKAYLRNLSTDVKEDVPVKIKENKSAGIVEYEIFVTASSLSESHSHWDSTAGVKLTITQYFDKQTIPQLSVSLDHSSAKWEKSDNTITITNASVTSAVYGYSTSGPLLNSREVGTVGTPSLNTWYSQFPSWRGTYVIINDLSYQASRADSTLVHGGSSWFLGFCVSQGGSEVISCD